MELDIIEDLLECRPGWTRSFPVVVGVEYAIDPFNKYAGRGDLVLSNEASTRFLVVELKRHTRARAKLLSQMVYYRDCCKRRHPFARVDCAAVAAGQLVAYRRDNRTFGPSMFFSPAARRMWSRSWRRAVPTSSGNERWELYF